MGAIIRLKSQFKKKRPELGAFQSKTENSQILEKSLNSDFVQFVTGICSTATL